MTMERMTWEEARKHAGQMLDKWSVLDAAEAILPHYLFTVGDEKHRAALKMQKKKERKAA